MQPPKTWRDSFAEKFGRDGPEANCDSIGRRAGCDDCSSNIELRAEHFAFIETTIAEESTEAYKNGYIQGQFDALADRELN